MPDITMCEGTNCPLTEKGYRYKAKPDIYQSYFMKPPYVRDECDYYWMIKEHKMPKTKTKKKSKICKKYYIQ